MTSNTSRGNSILTLDFWAESWISSVVLILLSCSLFCLFSLLRLGAWVGATLSLVWTLFRVWRSGGKVFTLPRFHGIEWGIPVLLALCLVSLLAGPHCFLDSYSYRIPQMFFWLQKGHPWSIPNVDMRINQMPHVWPMLSAAFYLPFGEWALALPNYLSLLLLASLFRHWAHRSINDDRKADAAALVFLSAPVFLMGGTTNDNVVTCVTFLALSLHFAERFGSLPSDEGALRRRTLALSAIAFALCCGIKPQYLVLSPLWGLWFFFAPSHPWKCLTTRLLVLLLPVLLLCSPVPTLAVNRVRWGSFMHPKVMDNASWSTSRTIEIAPQQSENKQENQSAKYHDHFRGEHSFVSLASQVFAIPINPFSNGMNRWVQAGNSPLPRIFRKHNIVFRPLVIPEVASLEFFVSVPLVVGLVTTLHRKRRLWLFVLSIIALMCVAIVYTKGGTLGRSYVGFFVLLCWVSFPAFDLLPSFVLSIWSGLCLLIGLAVIVTDPSRPLLPLRFLTNKLVDTPIASQFADFAHYSQRQHALRVLLSDLPSDIDSIGVVFEPDTPFGDIWLQHPGIRVVPYSHVPDAVHLAQDGIQWLIVKTTPHSRHDNLQSSPFLIEHGLFHMKTVRYVSFVSRGPEPWYLLKTDLLPEVE